MQKSRGSERGFEKSAEVADLIILSDKDVDTLLKSHYSLLSNAVMPLSEGTCLCLISAILILIWLLKDFVNERLPAAKNCASAQLETKEPTAASAPATVQTALLNPEEERKRLEVLLEARHREEWCKKFEEEEVARRFREQYCVHEYKRQLEEVRRFEQAQNTLRELMRRRENLERSLRLQNTA